MMETRYITLLRAAYELIKKQDESDNPTDKTVVYDDAECDSDCLKEDIEAWFESEGIRIERPFKMGDEVRYKEYGGEHFYVTYVEPSGNYCGGVGKSGRVYHDCTVKLLEPTGNHSEIIEKFVETEGR